MEAVQNNYLIVIAGPTAVGKTELAVQLAEHFKTAVLSADSRQFYREMNIGTAKPSSDQLKRVPHHFIDTKSVEELYGAGHFEKDAIALLDQLFKEHLKVIMVGGSGLYINAVLNGVDEFENVPPSVREELNREFIEKGLEWLQSELVKLDKNYSERVDMNNPQRIIRALEVCRYTGKPYSEFLSKNKATRNFKTIKIMLDLPREQLYQRINSRVEEMMRRGLLDEVKSLRDRKQHNALKTVGYSELNAYLDGELDLETAVSKIKQHTRNYAKRQLTWFRNQEGYNTCNPKDVEIVIDLITHLTSDS